MPGRPSREWGVLAVVVCLAVMAGCGGGADRRADDGEPTSTVPTSIATTTSTSAAPAPSTTAAPSSPTVPDPAPTTAPNPPEVAADPVELAAQLVQAERRVRDPAAAEAEVVEAAQVQQVAYRVLADHPEWDGTVGAEIPLDLVPAVMANVAARRELRSMHRRLLDTLPAWRIVEPRPMQELLEHYAEAERIYGVPWQYLAAINLVETGMGRVDGVSTAGAQGPMQFMPATWAAFGEGDVRDPRAAILAAGRYLAHSGAPGDMGKALLAYNRSGKYVRAVTHFAEVMKADPSAYRGYYHWQVYVLTVAGDVLLPVGYEQHSPIPVQEYLAAQD